VIIINKNNTSISNGKIKQLKKQKMVIRKEKLFRPCIRCGKKFPPKTKYTRLCEKCLFLYKKVVIKCTESI